MRLRLKLGSGIGELSECVHNEIGTAAVFRLPAPELRIHLTRIRAADTDPVSQLPPGVLTGQGIRDVYRTLLKMNAKD